LKKLGSKASKAPQVPQVPEPPRRELQLAKPSRAQKLRSMLPGVSKALAKATRGTAQDLVQHQSQQIAQKMRQEHQMQQQQQEHVKQRQQAKDPHDQPSGKGSLLVDRKARQRQIQNGLMRCNQGGNENTISSAASQVPMAQVLDDLHAHNLHKTSYTFSGLECFVEVKENPHPSDPGPTVFQTHSVEATSFSQLLVAICTRVFGLDPSVCHLYFDFEGATAAFNRGGALYFNFWVFLSQMELQQWTVKAILGPDRQPYFIVPREAIVDWMAVFAHELAHNHIAAHDANFSNWMMMYWTDFLDHLNALVYQYESAAKTGQLE